MGPGKVVYVGSIPYDYTEEQILDIFRSVGPVANFRLVFEKNTGKSKGFGFVEYHDSETAASAVRNLNGYQIGGRSLRVDYTHEGIPLSSDKPSSSSSSSSSGSGNTGNNSSGTSGGTKGVKSRNASKSLNLPPGKPLAKGASAAEEISKTINSYDKAKILEILSDFQHLSENNELTEKLLKQAPQLGYAIVQCLLALGLVDASGISGIIEGMYSNGLTAASENSNKILPTVATKPASPEPSAPASDDTEAIAVDPEQAALIKQVMLLSDEQLNALPEDQREALIALRDQVKSRKLVI